MHKILTCVLTLSIITTATAMDRKRYINPKRNFSCSFPTKHKPEGFPLALAAIQGNEQEFAALLAQTKRGDNHQAELEALLGAITNGRLSIAQKLLDFFGHQVTESEADWAFGVATACSDEETAFAMITELYKCKPFVNAASQKGWADALLIARNNSYEHVFEFVRSITACQLFGLEGLEKILALHTDTMLIFTKGALITTCCYHDENIAVKMIQTLLKERSITKYITREMAINTISLAFDMRYKNVIRTLLSNSDFVQTLGLSKPQLINKFIDQEYKNNRTNELIVFLSCIEDNNALRNLCCYVMGLALEKGDAECLRILLSTPDLTKNIPTQTLLELKRCINASELINDQDKNTLDEIITEMTKPFFNHITECFVV